MQPSSEGDLPLDGPHWTFALDLYRRPGVADACLLLQDKASFDISFLLFILFVAENYRFVVDRADLAKLDRTIAPWRDEVIRPLRSIRRRMKGGPAPAPGPATEALRDHIKAAEIQAEQIELAVLAQWLDQHPPKTDAAPVDIAVVLDQLAAFFTARSNQPSSIRSTELQAALDTIASAMSRPARA
jgi:uncharacterized protein (TIGR02444 family)